MIKVAIVDDEKSSRDRVRFIINKYSQEKIDVVFEAENGKDLLAQIQNYKEPDIILLDIGMPLLNGIETIKILKIKYPSIKIIMLTCFDSYTIKCLELGVDAYLSKIIKKPEKVIETIHHVMYKGKIIPKFINKDYLDF